MVYDVVSVATCPSKNNGIKMAQRWFNPILNSQNFQFIIHRSKTRQPVFILAMCSSSRDSSVI